MTNQWRFFIAAGLSLFLASLPSVCARADNFKIIATNLDGSPIPTTETVALRVFKLEFAGVETTATNFNLSLGPGGRLPVNTTPARDKDGHIVFTFTINPNDDVLTVGRTDSDKSILLVFTRNGVDTAVVPFQSVGAVATAVQSLSVAVPQAFGAAPRKPEVICPPPSDCSPARRSFFGCWRRR